MRKIIAFLTIFCSLTLLSFAENENISSENTRCTLNASVTVTNILCNGACDGEISITNVTGATGAIDYSIDGGTTWSSASEFTDLCAGEFSVRVKDEAACTFESIATITEPAAITFSVDMTSVSCNGGADGQIEIINVNGGTGVYEFSNDGGATYQSSVVFPNLSAGEYSVRVRDDNLCESIVSYVMITEPDAISFNVSINSNVSCNGGNDGEIEVTNVSGGISPYEFSKDGGASFQASDIFPNLSAGTYYIRIRDANLCMSTTTSVTITEPTAITFDPDVIANVTCNEGADGLLEVTNVSGGTPPYEYSNDKGTTYNLSSVFNGLTAGNYNVTVRDVNLCESEDLIVSITEPDAITFETTTTPASGGGASDGSIEVINVTGGTAPYAYSNNGGMTWQASSIFSGLAAGTYNIQVRDVNICTSDISSVTVTELAGFSVTFSITDAATGLPIEGADITAGGVSLTTNVNGFAGVDLPDGKHSFSISYTSKYSATGYIYVDEDPVSVSAALTANPLISYDFNFEHISCNGANDGEITFTDVAGGSNSGFEYSIDSGLTWQSNPFFPIVQGGLYYLQVKDDAGAYSVITSIAINEPEAVSFSAQVNQNVTCFGGSDGEIEITNVSGGSGTYFYGLNEQYPYQESNVFSGLIAGEYNVQVVDDNLCLSELQQLTITEPDEITFETETTHVFPAGSDNGAFEFVNVDGGTEPYEYSINAGNTWSASSVFTSLGEGLYDLQVRDANLCTSAISNILIQEFEAIEVILIDSLLSCGGSNFNNNSLMLLPDGTGDTCASTISFYEFENGQTLSSGDLDGIYIEIEHSYPGDLIIELVAPDGNSVILSNGRGGTRNLGYPIIQDETDPVPGEGYLYTFSDNANEDWMQVVTELTYYNGNPGPPDSLYIPAGNYVPENSLDNLVGTPLNGDWTLRIIDQFPVDNGHIFEWGLNFNEAIAPTATTCGGMLEVEAAGGSGTFTYEWNNGTIGKKITELCSGEYTVTVSDDYGNTTAQSFNVYSVDFQSDISEITSAYVTDNNGSATIEITGGNAPYTYIWDNANDNATADNLSAGWHYVTVTDMNQCTFIDSVEIFMLDSIEYSINSSSITCCGAADGMLGFADITGGTGSGYQFSIDSGNTWQTSTVFNNITSGQYTMVVKDDNSNYSYMPTLNIYQPDEVVLGNITVVDVSEFEGNDGMIDIANSYGGIGLKSYTIDSGLTWQYDTLFDNLAAGSYDVLAKDLNGCLSDSEVVTVNQPQEVYYTVTFFADEIVKTGIEGAEITINDTVLITDINGFAYIDLLPGSYEYEATYYDEGPLTGTVEVVSEDVEVNLLFGSGPTWSTAFYVYENNQPVENATIEIEGEVLHTNMYGFAMTYLENGLHSYVASYGEYDDINGTVYIYNEIADEHIHFTGIGQVLESELNIYPNPVSTTLNIDLEGSYKVTLVNSIGKVILTQNMETHGTLEVDNFADGLYLLRIEQNGQVITKPVIIKK